MMLRKKLATGIATAGALGMLLAPASALANNSGYGGMSYNGAGSENNVEISHSSSVNVEQNSSTNSDTSVVTVNNTGENTIEGATGGDSTIRTGHAISEVAVVNHGSTNNLDLNACNCQNQNHDYSVMGGNNGWRSNNSFKYESEHNLDISQDADTDSSTDVTVVNNTGDNEIEGSTGSSNNSKFSKNYDWWFWKDHNNDQNGDSEIVTGNALSSVMVHNYGSENNLSVH